MLKQEDLFLKLNFSEVQLDALRQIYEKYFERHIPPYKGAGFIAIWKKGYKFTSGQGFDLGHNNPGICVDECEDDPLWDNFSDLLPHMIRSAVITKMPPGGVMWPHVDRKFRPQSAIYFPLKGCTEDCVSSYYDLPKRDTEMAYTILENPTPLYTFSVSGNAVLENTREWHSVRNNSNVERVAFGWNMLPKYTFDESKQILKELGYLR